MKNVYYLYFRRQLGLTAPLLDRIETINAVSVNDAVVIGEEKCRYYAEKSNGRYIYTCKVSEGSDFK